jgi:AraC-like DNA-binding protein
MGEGESLDIISSKCGFTDYSTFFKAFKKEFGISPREYLKI